nr:fimbrial biogenesis outer membrane usher protein [uncultured Cedecea sp.]
MPANTSPIFYKTLIAISIALSISAPAVSANTKNIQEIDGIIIPQTFSQVLQNGMSIPLFIHFKGSSGTESDQRIGNAQIFLEKGKILIKKIELENNSDNATVNELTRQKLDSISDEAFNQQLIIDVTQGAQLSLNLKQLLLQLVVDQQALGTILRSRSEDIGESSVNAISSTLDYSLGVYNNQMRTGGSNTSSYLSLNSVTALREHHVALDGSLYGIGSNNRDFQLYKVMYERDFAGKRFAAGMLDTWNLQSLGPMNAISAGKIYGASWGNESSSTVFDDTQSITPIVAFLPAAGEVHVLRDDRLMSVQNFNMGNHEVDTSKLPFGIYDVEVEVIVNGAVVSKRMQRVNKIYSGPRGAGTPLRWQVWGGSFHMERWSEENKILPAKDSMLAGVSAAGSLKTLSWAASGYGYDNLGIAETRLSLPVLNTLQVSIQNMLASDKSASLISSVTAALPGGFSSIWINQERTKIGDRLRRSTANNQAIGGTLNLNALTNKLGTLTVSYNDDHRYKSRYYTADYSQNVYSGTYGSVAVRAGVQRYNSLGNSSSNLDKYIALDFSLPLGNWISAGMTHQNGYTLANIAARKNFDEDSTIRSVGANISRAISGDTRDDKTLSGGAYAQFNTRYSAGTLNVNTGTDGYINTNLTASGSAGWQGKHFAASGRSEGNSGIIINTGLDDNTLISAKVNGRYYPVKGKYSYLPLSPYSRNEIEIQNNKNSQDSYDIVSNRKTNLTLYPGNVAVIEPGIKQMVTVSGRIRAENGTVLSNAKINNHIGRTQTDNNGEFVMDIDKKYPTIDFNYGANKTCEVELELSQARGAIWVGDVVCTGLKSYASNKREGTENES